MSIIIKVLKNKKLITAILIFLFFSISLFPFGLNSGTYAPAFLVSSGNKKVQTLGYNKGKIIILFYEFRNTIDKNLLLKNTLKQYYNEHKDEIEDDIVRLPVVDASSSFWPISLIWRRELRRHSKIAKMTIYADWSGKMFKAYKIKKYSSNFFIIDTEGIIRYYNYGEIGNREIKKIKKILNDLYFN